VPHSCKPSGDLCAQASDCCTGSVTTPASARPPSILAGARERPAPCHDCCGSRAPMALWPARVCLRRSDVRAGGGLLQRHLHRWELPGAHPACRTAGMPARATPTAAPTSAVAPMSAGFLVVHPGSDACSRDNDCCSGMCTLAGGAAIGTCAEPPSGPSHCGVVDGQLCAGCGECCSRLCAPYGRPESSFANQPAAARECDLCRVDSDCCGAAAPACRETAKWSATRRQAHPLASAATPPAVTPRARLPLSGLRM